MYVLATPNISKRAFADNYIQVFINEYLELVLGEQVHGVQVKLLKHVRACLSGGSSPTSSTERDDTTNVDVEMDTGSSVHSDKTLVDNAHSSESVDEEMQDDVDDPVTAPKTPLANQTGDNTNASASYDEFDDYTNLSDLEDAPAIHIDARPANDSNGLSFSAKSRYRFSSPVSEVNLSEDFHDATPFKLPSLRIRRLNAYTGLLSPLASQESLSVGKSASHGLLPDCEHPSFSVDESEEHEALVAGNSEDGAVPQSEDPGVEIHSAANHAVDGRRPLPTIAGSYGFLMPNPVGHMGFRNYEDERNTMNRKGLRDDEDDDEFVPGQSSGFRYPSQSVAGEDALDKPNDSSSNPIRDEDAGRPHQRAKGKMREPVSRTYDDSTQETFGLLTPGLNNSRFRDVTTEINAPEDDDSAEVQDMLEGLGSPSPYNGGSSFRNSAVAPRRRETEEERRRTLLGC